jgi:hypothetical protein
VARHRRPVNVRDDGLPAVLGPLITAGGIELAVLLEVDSGMVLDAWAKGGEAETPDAEALGARHADVVRALLALSGSPPAELALTVDKRHHLVRCVADPAGGRLALAVVVNSTPWVVRRVRRHLRQLPDAGLTTGPWMLSWAIGPRPQAQPTAQRPPAAAPPGPSAADPARFTPDGPLSMVTVGDPEPLLDAGGHATAVPTTGPAATVPDPRRGPAPPSALPPARSAGW